MIRAEFSAPPGNPAGKVKVGFRVPGNHSMRSVTVNGHEWADFDPAGEWGTFPGSLREAVSAVQY